MLRLPAQDAGSLSAETCWLRTRFRGARRTVIPQTPRDRTGSRTGWLSSGSFVISPPRAAENARRCRQGGGGANRAALRAVTPRAQAGRSAAGTDGAARRGASGRAHGPAATAPPSGPLPRPRRTDDLRAPAARLRGPGRHRSGDKAEGGDEGDPPHPAGPAPSPRPRPSAARQLTASPRAAAPRAALSMGSARRDRPRERGARRDGR